VEEGAREMKIKGWVILDRTGKFLSPDIFFAKPPEAGRYKGGEESVCPATLIIEDPKSASPARPRRKG
jgi:hypothetical protein